MADLTSIRKSTAIAWRALQRNKLQTILTMCGMTIGVATVLTMIALGSGAQAAIQDQVRAAGMNVIVVSSGNYKMQQQWTSQGEAEEPAAYLPEGYRARFRTLEHFPCRCRVEHPRLWAFSAMKMPLHAPSGIPSNRENALTWKPSSPVSLTRVFQPGTNPQQGIAHSGENAAGLGASDKLSLSDADAIADLNGVQWTSAGVAENVLVKAADATWYTRMHGEGKDLPSIRRAWTFTKGRFFSGNEIATAANTIVLGSIAAERLFGNANPIGRNVTIRGRSFHVVGVVGSSSWMVPAAIGDDQFDAIYVPVTTGQNLLGKQALDSITVSTVSTGDVTRVTKSIAALLRQRHGLAHEDPDDFVVSSQARKSLARGGMRTDIARAITGNVTNLDKVTLEQLGKTLDRASRTMTALLASIASVSLIVGGIGIMNIMLLSVTERTKEIGIRRAVGARSNEVMLQFLIEAVTLSLTGGVLGILFGVLASGSITRMVAWSTSISPLAIFISFGLSAVVGILFGYYPAREASRVTPMTSLRYE
ncbi:ABC transporter permease [Terriglobus albidus]|uniref:ABC transporter permease n=1 Tax=Terriglobus albidus TaxID=1592106 RepID=UPI0021E08513|nr:ABC transporter permease [Terriglobus albidus]